MLRWCWRTIQVQYATEKVSAYSVFYPSVQKYLFPVLEPLIIHASRLARWRQRSYRWPRSSSHREATSVFSFFMIIYFDLKQQKEDEQLKHTTRAQEVQNWQLLFFVVVNIRRTSTDTVFATHSRARTDMAARTTASIHPKGNGNQERGHSCAHLHPSVRTKTHHMYININPLYSTYSFIVCRNQKRYEVLY